MHDPKNLDALLTLAAMDTDPPKRGVVSLDEAPLPVLIDTLRHLTEDTGLPVGTTRVWSGKPFKKVGPGKWVFVPAGRQKKAAGAGGAAPASAAAPEPVKGMAGIMKEPTAPVPAGATPLDTDPNKVGPDGVTIAARVGLAGSATAPPQKVPRLPNLTPDERAAESRFADAYQADPDAMVNAYRDKLESREIGDAPNVFATDDAKLLSPDYNPTGVSEDEVKQGRGRYNTAVHQTASAVVKRAFLHKLDELSKLPADDPKRNVLITSGGVASGKGYALGKNEQVNAISKSVGAVWDAAGEANATENPWVLDELKKRGLKGTFVFVDSDPSTRWENPKMGVVQRAKKIGRMVDARLFSDSYAVGAKNFDAFHKSKKDDPDAQFFVLSARTDPPSRVDAVSKEALSLDADKLYAKTSKVIDDDESLPPVVRRGASTGRRIWGPPPSVKESKAHTTVEVKTTKIPKSSPVTDELADKLLKNLKSNLQDPESYENEKAARDKKAKPVSLPGKRVVPPPLDKKGTLAKAPKKR